MATLSGSTLARGVLLAWALVLWPWAATAHLGDPFHGPGTDFGQLFVPFEESARCADCHTDLAAGWRLSGHGNAARDPVFVAAAVVANQDFFDGGSFCWRCHAPTGWLDGRGLPGSGTALTPEDREGLACAFCHRLEVGAARQPPGPLVGNGGFYVADEKVYRSARGSTFLPAGAHRTRPDPFGTTPGACAGCHSLSNPIQPLLDPDDGDELSFRFPGLRTYDEWATSAFAEEGVDCLACHATRAPGRIAQTPEAPTRGDVFDHVLSGGVGGRLELLALVGGWSEAERLRAKAAAEAVSRRAATLEILAVPQVWPDAEAVELIVRVTNLTGHKLPTGWLEGRRLWLEVTVTTEDDRVVFASGVYDRDRRRLPEAADDPFQRRYEAVGGRAGEGPGLHFLLDDTLYVDTRIPPRGHRVGADTQPRGRDYCDADGRCRHFDEALYVVPALRGETGRLAVTVRLLSQSPTPEYVEFLEAENVTDDSGRNLRALYDEAGADTPLELARVVRRVPTGGVPPRAEVCDGGDDDGDRAVDEGTDDAVACGVGRCARVVPGCAHGAPQRCVPDAPVDEACNAVDDDCDGEVDESIDLLRCGLGACARAVPGCVGGGVPGPCVPGIPGVEVCNGEDDDCDGGVDEDQPVQACGTGLCARTAPGCVDGVVPPCVAGPPSAETCDGRDEDCDGTADEALPRLRCVVGACDFVLEACLDGVPARCEDGSPEHPEQCNGVDDDCDAEVDEDTGNVPCGVGRCARTAPACVDGRPSAVCEPGLPLDETCDGEDDDCDGRVDEALPPIVCGLGACESVAEPGCVNGAPALCVPFDPLVEICDGRDDDCDGEVDEGLAARRCGLGECAREVAGCTDGRRVPCVPGPPAPEVCGGLDEDCDGRADEALQCEPLTPDASFADAAPFEDARVPPDADPDADPDAAATDSRSADLGPPTDAALDATEVLQDTLAAVDARRVDAAPRVEDAAVGPPDGVDARPSAAPDAGRMPVPPAGRARDPGGCAVSPPNGPSPTRTAALALGVLVVLVVRRQRAAVSSTRALSARASRT